MRCPCVSRARERFLAAARPTPGSRFDNCALRNEYALSSSLAAHRYARQGPLFRGKFTERDDPGKLSDKGGAEGSRVFRKRASLLRGSRTERCSLGPSDTGACIILGKIRRTIEGE